MKYLVKDFVWVHWRDLEVHPEAKVPIAEEDAEALKRSVEEEGMIQPLLVIPREETRQDAASPKGNEGKKEKKGKKGKTAGEPPAPPARKRWWIVDGANRFRAYAGGEKAMPCVVVELGEGVRVRDLALECASVGRSRSAGQRIMVYLERNKAAVLEAAEKGREATQFGTVVSRDTTEKIKAFRADTIAETLGVSNKDTLLAIDLLKSHEERVGVSKRVGALVEEGKKLEEGDPELKAIDEAWAGVLAGTTPIRRWKAAVGGRKTTKEVQRAATDVRECAVACAKKFKTFGGKAWEKLPLEDRVLVCDAFRKVRELVPQEVLEVLRVEWERRHG